MEYITLQNGVKAPVLGIGTFTISPADTETSVYEAIKMGYRMVDTANAYLNEEAVGGQDLSAAGAVDAAGRAVRHWLQADIL